MILITAPNLVEEIQQWDHLLDGYDYKIHTSPERTTEAEMIGLVDGVHVVICGDDEITPAVVDAGQDLRAIIKWGTGIDSIAVNYAKSKGVEVINYPGAFTIPVTETTLAMITSLVRRIPENDKSMKTGAWIKLKGYSLAEMTVGIVGMGNIGKSVYGALWDLAARILWYDPNVKNGTPGKCEFDYLLKHADVITLHCDLNPSSHHLINKDAIEKMRDDVILVNTSRGSVIDQSAMTEALMAGKFGGLGLDVYEREPLDGSSMLRIHNNVILSPHNANTGHIYWNTIHASTIRDAKRFMNKNKQS